MHLQGLELLLTILEYRDVYTRGHSERERKGVYGLGGLWRIVWCMEIGAIGVVKVGLCVLVGR